LNRIAIWKLEDKKHQELTVLDLHPEFAEQGMLNEHVAYWPAWTIQA
jgi:hypothetical protein